MSAARARVGGGSPRVIGNVVEAVPVALYCSRKKYSALKRYWVPLLKVVRASDEVARLFASTSALITY